MHPQFRFIRRAIYDLKRKYPLPLTLCTTTGTVTDFNTGIQTETLTKYQITKAIVLPTRESRSTLPDLALVEPYRPGATYDSQLRKIIVDRRDLPTSYNPTLNDFVFFNSKRYELKIIEELDHREAIIFYIDMTRGAPMNDTITLTVSDNLTATDGATYVIQ